MVSIIYNPFKACDIETVTHLNTHCVKMSKITIIILNFLRERNIIQVYQN